MELDNRMADSSSDEPRTPRAIGDVERVSESEGKYFNDPVHGHFRLRPVSCAIVDTRPFQRLRQLKQLGFSYYVYPGASHNRFEHCLGVAHLSGKWTEELMRSDRETSDEIERCASLVEVAGLCHDLGHGPFSHAWENAILPALHVEKWRHEAMSAQLVDYVFDAYEISERFALSRHDRDLVKAMIAGDKPSGSSGMCDVPVYLFDIVNNRTNGIDVDKLDYLQRDSLYTNVRVAAPYGRLLQFTKTDGANIRFRLRERENLSKVFEDRATLHRDVYTHKTSKAIELMVCDALKEVGHDLGLAEKSRDTLSFLTLSDTLLDHVVNFFEPASLGAAQKAKKAKELLLRVEHRDLYQICGEMRIPETHISMFRNGVPPTEITTRQNANGQVDLRPDDIHVSVVYIDRGMDSCDPLERIRFYQERPEEHCAFSDVVRPLQWMWLRVYCKKKEHIQATRAAFQGFVKSCASPTTLTPERLDQRPRPHEAHPF